MGRLAVNSIYSGQKAALTRAIKSGDKDAILAAVRKAVAQWNAVDGPFHGAWPDDWHRWNIALQDAFGFMAAPSMEDM